MSNAQQMYALSLDQVTDSIAACGHKRTVLMQGDMGTGKSSVLKMLGERFPDHTLCYFDCTTKDLGDVTIPNLVAGTPEDTESRGYVTYLTNEELGVHNNKPIILMIDEYGKANPAVKNALLRLMLERKMGSYTLHPESIVFATTNLGAEGVGDLMLPHQRNRITVVTTRKPTNLEWISWGLNNNIDHTLLGWAKDNPQLFQSFTEVANPDDNDYIFHPQAAGRTAFFTPRSGEAASDWMKQRSKFDNHTLTSLLIGTIGERGAMDLMAFVTMADQMPSRDDIINDPRNAKVPTSAAAVCMVVFRTLASIERDWMDAWMTYLERLDTEAQGMFANGVRDEKYGKRSMVMTNKRFQKWALDNNYLFGVDV